MARGCVVHRTVGQEGRRRQIEPGRAALRLLTAAAAITRTASQCDFDGDIDPDKQMMGLQQDYNAYSLDVCKDNCCTDTSCTAYQFQQGFHGQMSCMRGSDGGDLQDSGGMPWQGEAGKGGKDSKGKGGKGGGAADDWADERLYALPSFSSPRQLLPACVAGARARARDRAGAGAKAGAGCLPACLSHSL